MPDPSRPWGNPNCTECAGTCSGHYLKPSSDLKNLQQSAVHMVGPPSHHVKKEFKEMNGHLSNAKLVELAKNILFPVEEVGSIYDT